MRRQRLPWRRWIPLFVALPIALLALLPMRLAFGWCAFDAHGIGARAVRGSVWSGVIEEMRVGGLSLGTVDGALSPFPLLLGRARFNLARHGENGADLDGAIIISRNSIGIDDFTGSLSSGGLLTPLPITGLEFDDVRVRFVDGDCRRAEGRVRARLSGALPGIAFPRELTGSVKCDGRHVRVSLAGQSGRVRIDLSIDARGNFTADLPGAASIRRPAPPAHRPAMDLKTGGIE